MTFSEPHVARVGYVRWFICAMLFFVVALNYVDRQVLSVLKPTLQGLYGWSETGYGDVVFWFQAAYGVGYVIFGRIVDRFGAKVGATLAVSVWTIAHIAHAFVRTTAGFTWVRIPMGLGESGLFPSTIAATTEWFPKKERALAIGIFNAGSNVGAIVAPIIVPVITILWGWQAAFIITGLLTVIWLAVWLIWYRTPRQYRGLKPTELTLIESDPQEPQRPVAWITLLKTRQTWAYILGRFLIDPVWWTFLFWLPDFFSKRYGVDLKHYGPPLVAIYIMADIGSVLGGWRSSNLIKRGFGLGRARKIAMLTCAVCALPVAFAMYAGSLWLAVAIIGLACAAHQGFSANLFALPSDLFPRWASGSILGLGGLSGALGGMLMSKFAANVLQTVGSYTPIFVFASLAYLFALLVIHLIVPRYALVTPAQLSGK
ncbi:MAG: putative permease [Alphaproteobacteria bacterium]|nr:putative permease [Alphaproteobacteria bacterium]MDB5741184.1 putative permease [Alphaproteobacteria bacterium]